MKSQRLLLIAALSSVSFAARMKRPESMIQTESDFQAQHAFHVSVNVKEAKKAAESAGVVASRTPTKAEAKEFIDVHNKYRCMHGAEDVTWSDAMAEDAHTYISKLTRMKHSDSYGLSPPAGPAGENLYMASWAATPSQAVDAWYSEVNDCKGGPTAFTDGCAHGAGGAVTGHFTVMVWTGVKEIGCAFGDTEKGLIICRYKAGDRLSAETPNMNKGSGNYVSHVLVRSRTAEQCGAGSDSGNGGPEDDGVDSGDSKDPDNSGKIDYQHCVPDGSVSQCGKCTHSSQCGQSNDGRSMFCCPYLKTCVPDSSTGCNFPVAQCNPPCHEKTSEAKCKCKDSDYPTTWLGKTCGTDGADAGGGSLPTPATPAPTAEGIDYENCVPKHSVEQCGECTHHGQCGKSKDGRDMFCCPYMKKCVPDGSTGCYQPIANCRPPCNERNSEAKCKCGNNDYPTIWLGRTCGPNGGPLPTPAPTAKPTPKPTEAGSCQDKASQSSCKQWQNAGYCTKQFVSYMKKNCCATCSGGGGTPAEPEDPGGSATKDCVKASGKGQCVITTDCSGMTKVTMTCTKNGGESRFTATMPGSYTYDLTRYCTSCNPIIDVKAA